MKSIVTSESNIHFNETGYDALNALIKSSNYSKVIVLVDENTHELCLPVFLQLLDTSTVVDIIEIEAGEDLKNVETCAQVWEAMSDLGGDRKTLLLNLGGGVITDLGGFVASAFKRGIAFVNVPTSLLAMVDASIGGKTGVDLGSLKNQIGVINLGEMVLVDTRFLNTLPENQMRSGMAEMFKHGLITSEDYWNKMVNWSELNIDEIEQLIYESIKIKQNIVSEDPFEKGKRKTLNFGHTLGHAIESFYLSHPEKEPLLHGEAIAIGMILATFLSNKLTGFPTDKMEHIKTILIDLFGRVSIDVLDYQPIMDLLKFDKKNTHGNINFVLLKDIGSHELDCIVPDDLIIEAFQYYNA